MLDGTILALVDMYVLDGTILALIGLCWIIALRLMAMCWVEPFGSDGHELDGTMCLGPIWL